jgi:single-strand DNA-binding protein
MNKIIIAGRIGTDAETKEVGERLAINFPVAVSESSGNEKKTTWYKATIWRKKDKGDIAGYLKKGTCITVMGRPKAEAWLNKEGQAEGSIRIDVDDVELQGKPSSSSES